jgi:hypothetical protein
LLGLSFFAFGAPLSFGSALGAARSAGRRMPALVALVVSGLLLIAASFFLLALVWHIVDRLAT